MSKCKNCGSDSHCGVSFKREMRDGDNKIVEISERVLKKNNIKFKELGEPLRMILTGSSKAPSIKEIVKILGINETISRLKKYI